MELVITPAGTVRAVYDETLDLTVFGKLTITRGSCVEPTADGCWTADLAVVGGPQFGPFRLRSEALAAERTWLESIGSRGPEVAISPPPRVEVVSRLFDSSRAARCAVVFT